MPSILILLTAAALLQAQDVPKITLETKGRFSELIKKIEKATSCRIPVSTDIEDKEISVSIRDAGFFEALDALCRAHGNVRYFDPEADRHGREDPLHLRPGALIDHPSAYQGPFKIFVPAINRMRSRSVDGEQAWAVVHLALIAPPTIPVTWTSGASAEWKLLEAKDAAGKSVLMPDPSPREQIAIGGSDYYGSNITTTSEYVRSFDLDRGLSLLKGEVKLVVTDSKEVQIAVEPGKEIDVPGGRILVDSVKNPEENSWRIALTMKPSKGETSLRKLLENRFQKEGGDWDYLRLPYEGLSFEVDVHLARRRPAWVRLRILTGERTLTVPYELRDVRFKKD